MKTTKLVILAVAALLLTGCATLPYRDDVAVVYVPVPDTPHLQSPRPCPQPAPAVTVQETPRFTPVSRDPSTTTTATKSPDTRQGSTTTTPRSGSSRGSVSATKSGRS